MIILLALLYHFLTTLINLSITSHQLFSFLSLFSLQTVSDSCFNKKTVLYRSLCILFSNSSNNTFIVITHYLLAAILPIRTCIDKPVCICYEYDLPSCSDVLGTPFKRYPVTMVTVMHTLTEGFPLPSFYAF